MPPALPLPRGSRLKLAAYSRHMASGPNRVPPLSLVASSKFKEAVFTWCIVIFASWPAAQISAAPGGFCSGTNLHYFAFASHKGHSSRAKNIQMF
eukprot:1673684-Rhodomonas_salina.1